MKSVLRLLFLGLILIWGVDFCYGQSANPDARFLSVVREYTLLQDGGQTFRESFSLKLLSHRAFHRMYGESFIVYNPQFQKLKINKAETIMADGRIVEAPANAFNEVLPSWASGSAAFNHLREMVISHTGLEVGATIYLDYRIESRANYFPYLSGAEVASLSSPVEAFKVIIRIPSGTPFNYKVLNIRLAPEVSKEKGFDVYTFNFGPTQALPQDSFLPASFHYLPALIFSTSGKWEDLLPLQTVLSNPIPAEATQAVRSLKEKHSNNAALAAAIREMVAHEWVTLQVKPIYTGFTMRNLQDVWNTRSGTPAEKAMLLAVLLQEAGFNAYPAIAFLSQCLTNEILPAALAENFYVVVEGEGLSETIFSPVGTATRDERPFLYGMTLVGIKKDGKRVNTLIAPVNSECRVEAALNIDTSVSISGSVKIKAEGLFNPYFALLSDKNNFKGLLQGFDSEKAEVTLQRSNLRKVEGTFSVSGYRAVKKKGELYIFEIPHAAKGVDSWNTRILPSQREAPFSLPNFVLEEYKYTLVVPEGWEVITPEYSREIKKDFGGVLLKLVKKGNVVEIYQAIEFIEKEISRLNYPSLREILNTWHDPSLQVLMLRKN